VPGCRRSAHSSMPRLAGAAGFSLLTCPMLTCLVGAARLGPAAGPGADGLRCRREGGYDGACAVLLEIGPH
jgi:hypothetical protein